jgi:hypothetical protein
MSLVKNTPIVRLKSTAEHELMFRYLYDIGFRYKGKAVVRGWQMYRANNQGNPPQYPLITLCRDIPAEFICLPYDASEWYSSDSYWSPSDEIYWKYTRVNSTKQFLSFLDIERERYAQAAQEIRNRRDRPVAAPIYAENIVEGVHVGNLNAEAPVRERQRVIENDWEPVRIEMPVREAQNAVGRVQFR